MDSMQSLWRVLNGNTAMREEQSILSEVRDSKEQLINGISYYKTPSEASRKKLEANQSVTGNKLEFVKKASILLNLDEGQSLTIFQCYLAQEYRDSAASLNTTLQTVKGQQSILMKLLHFFFTERLACLNCLNYILTHIKNEDHPLVGGLGKEVEAMNTEDKVRTSLLNQLRALQQPDYFNVTAEDIGMLLTSGLKQSLKSVFQNQLQKELVALLRTLYIYNHHYKHTPDTYITQCKLLINQFIKSPAPCTMVTGLSVGLCLDGLDMDHIFEHFDKDKELLQSHYLTVNRVHYDKVNELYSVLGSHNVHAPLLIAWAVVRYALASSPKEQAHSRHLGQQGLKKGGVGTLLPILKCPQLKTAPVTQRLLRITVYKVLATTLSIFHEDTLGDTCTLAEVASEVLKEDMLSSEFWDACAERGVGVILSSAASTFPHTHLPMTLLCKSLAKSLSSCEKLVQFLSSLSLFTTEIPRAVFRSSVEETDVDWLYTNPAPFPLVPGRGFMAKSGTQCNLLATTASTAVVQWLHDYSIFGYLDNEMMYLSKWAGLTTDAHFCWRLDRLTDCVTVVSRLAKSYPDIIEVLDNVLQLLPTILSKLRSDNKSHSLFIATSIKLLSVDSVTACWTTLNKINFLPSNGAGSSFWTGMYTDILNYYERPATHFPVTLALLKLLENAFRCPGFVNQPKALAEGASVLLYILRDVFRGIQKWRFEQPEVKLKMCKLILKIIVLALKQCDTLQEEGSADNSDSLTVLQSQILPALHSGPSSRTLLHIVTWCNQLESGNMEPHIQKKVCSVVSHALTALSSLFSLSPPGTGLEQALVTSTGESSNVAALIATYTYQNISTKLALHATRLLTHICTTNAVSLYSAVGTGTVSLALAFVNRLSSRSQDVYIKSAILDFISAAVESQPSLTELFMGVEKGGVLGEGSCMLPVLDYIKRSTTLPLVLVCSVYRLLYKVWHYRHSSAIAALKKVDNFWDMLCKHSFQEIDVESKSISSYELLIRAYTFHILASDLFYSPEEASIKMVATLQERDCFLYWTKVLKRICGSVEEIEQQAEESSQDSLFLLPLSEAYLSFVRAWRSFLIVTLVVRPNDNDKLKDSITFHIAGALYNQTANLDKKVTLKASAEFASLLTILLKHHKNSTDQPVLVRVCVQVLETACKSSHDLNQIVTIPVLASLLNVFQGLDGDIKSQVMLDSGSINELVVLLCNQLTSPQPHQLVCLTCATLCQVLETLSDSQAWFSHVKKAIPDLVRLAEENLLQGAAEVSEAALSVMVCLARLQQGAVTLIWANIQRLLCFSPFYTDKLENSDQSERLWFLGIELVTTLLSTLEMKYAEEAVLFACIRQERLMQVMGSLRTDFSHIIEAEYLSRLLYSLAPYTDMWHLRSSQCLTDVGTILGTIIPVITHYISASPRPADSSPNKDSVKTSEVAQGEVLSLLTNFSGLLRVMTPALMTLLQEQLSWQCPPAPLLQMSFSSPAIGTEGPPSYGTLTSCMRGCLTMLQRVDPCKPVTPTKGEGSKTEELAAQKTQLIFCLENFLYILMSQSHRTVSDGTMDPSEVHHMKRELGMELKTILEGIHRHFRRGSPYSPKPSSDRTLSSSSQSCILENPQLAFFKLGYQYVNSMIGS